MIWVHYQSYSYSPQASKTRVNSHQIAQVLIKCEQKHTEELAIIFSHFNNGSLALTYLTNLVRPYDLEPFLTKFGR